MIYWVILRRACVRHGIALVGYCLMTNHVHLLLEPQTALGLALGLGRAHRDYAVWQHVKQGLTGHLWQNRFYSCPLDEERLWTTLRYVEENPVRAGLVAQAWDWPWSSALVHVGGKDELGLVDLERWARNYDAKTWREVLLQGRVDSGLVEQIRRATWAGRPLGSEEFLERLERQTGRALRLKKMGRRPKVIESSGG